MWARQGEAFCERLLSNHMASLNPVWQEYPLSYSSQKLIMNFRLVEDVSIACQGLFHLEYLTIYQTAIFWT